MQLAGKIMSGAQGRLLPPSIPYRFFIASGIFHIAAWGLLLSAADLVPDYQGGPGYVLAALHALTLGVFVMTAIGASLQILPVVTGRSLPSLVSARITSWLFISGVGVLVAGFAIGDTVAMAAGGILVAAGLALYVSLIWRLLGGASGFRVLTIHIQLAFCVLVVVAGLGVGMIFGLMPMAQAALAAAHGILAIYGLMGLFAMGFGSILVPMFALANSDSEGRSLFIMWFYGAGLVVAVTGTLLNYDEVALIGAGLLLICAVAHVLIMSRVLKKGMKKKLGIAFVLIRTSWVLFPASIALGIAAASGIAFEPIWLIAGYLAVFGWLLTFVLGVKQQIMPFLAVMNVSSSGGKPPRLSQLAKGPALKVHAGCHFTALVLVGTGIAANMQIAVQAGAGFGIVGAVAFLFFTVDVYRRMLTISSASNKE